jgi:glycosyltransferase involved in cell wall biosynthesis
MGYLNGNARKRIAIVGVGVIGIPVLSKILSDISQHYDITIYSFIHVDRSKGHERITIRSVHGRIHQRLRYLILGAWFILDHLRYRYHALHAQSAFPGGVMARFFGKLFNIPWMVTLIGGEVEAMPHVPFGDLLNKKLRSVTTKVCSEAHLLTVMSEFQANSVKSNLNLQRDIKVLPYAPEVSTWYEKQVTFPVKLLHVAYHHPVKNHDMLLSTIQKLVGEMPFKLTIVGANYDEKFRRKIRQMDLQDYVEIKGAQSYALMQSHYREAHILLHTSWYEGLPATAFEAMANGTVVCGTHVGIMADFSGTYCLTVPPGDDTQLAQKVLALVYDASRYATLRKTAHEWAKANSSTHYVNQLQQWYEALR